MRTIKFRRYDYLENKMESIRTMNFDMKTNECIYTTNNFSNGARSPSASPLLQFTGFKDLNGREIFEGDIIKYVNQLYKVEFFNGGFFLRGSTKYDGESDLVYGIHFSDMADLEKHCEIVGNVFENQEMFKWIYNLVKRIV